MVSTSDFGGHRNRRDDRHLQDALRANGRRDDARVSLEIVYLVLFAGLIHALWNAMVKGVSSRATSFALTNGRITVDRLGHTNRKVLDV